jgi:Na+/melibiose symporter-like transporter
MALNAASAYLRQFIFLKFGRKFGKFRTWVVVGAIPAVVCLILISWLPFNDMEYHSRLWTLHLLFATYGIFDQFRHQSDNIRNLLSPNSQERSVLTAVRDITGHALGGIVMIVVPMVAVFTGGMADIMTYRIVIPAFVILFAPLALFQAFGVKDKVIIEEKYYEANINMFSGFKEVVKNKYLWIINLSNVGGAFSWGSVAMLNVFLIFALRQDWLLGVIGAVIGISGAPSVILVPWLIKKFGKRKTVLGCRFIFYGWFIMAFFAIRADSMWMMLVALIFNNVFSQTVWVVQGVMIPDVWDYQQYISGKRLEACANVFNLFTLPIATVLGLIVPAVYAAIGFTTDWDILFVPELRTQVLMWTLLLLLLGHTGGTLPYLFYDLSDKRHREIIEVLKERKEALDNANGATEPDTAGG